jgi:hypothetical protein
VTFLFLSIFPGVHQTKIKSRVRETTTEGQKKRVRKKRIEKIAETNMKMGRGS